MNEQMNERVNQLMIKRIVVLVSDIPESERSQNIIKNWKKKIEKVKRGDNLFKIPLTMAGDINNGRRYYFVLFFK